MKKIIKTFVLVLILYLMHGLTVCAEEIVPNITVITEEIKAPGEVQIEIILSEKTQLHAVNMVFKNKENSDKSLYYWLRKDELQYIEEENKNICTISLASNVVAGTYLLEEIELVDQTEQSIKYLPDEITSVEMVIVSGCEDTDIVVPVLTGISVDQKVESGEYLKAYIKVADDSGLKSADLVYFDKNTETYLFLYPEERLLDDEKEIYTFVYKIPKYQEAVKYEFDAICLTDNSAYENSVTYWRDGENLINTEGLKISAEGCRFLSVYYENSENAASVLQMNLYKVVKNAKTNSTVIYRGGDSDGSLWILDDNSLVEAKARQIKFILPDMLTDSEIIIDGAMLPSEFSDETYAGFMFDELPEAGYDIKLQMTHSKLPFSLKFKMENFEKLASQAFQLYKVNKDGTLSSEGTPVFIDKEGYILLEFPNGLQSTEEWNRFHIIETEAEPVPKIDSVKISATKYIYNGSVKTPTVTVKDTDNNILVKGTDYDLKYSSGRKKVGRYNVTVTLKGKYSGTYKRYFTIVPKAVTNLKSIRYQYGNQIRISWTKASGATGYRIYRKKTTSSKYTYLKSTKNNYYVSSGMAKNAAYRFKVIPYYKNDGVQYYSSNAYATVLKYTRVKGGKLVQISNVKAAKKGTKVKVSWKNVGYETGYQISRSTSKTGTNIVKTYKTTKGTSTTVSAAKGKTYYYKVRAYRTVNNKKIYGAWSKTVKYKRK